MDPKSPGMLRYFYEYMFQQSIERSKEAQEKTIMVSGARKLRQDLDDVLASQGASLDSRPPVSQVMAAIETVMSRGVAGHQAVFAVGGTQDPAYRAMLESFTGHIQTGRGDAGPRLPISPYDPRWSNRSTVKTMGSSLTFVLDADVEQMAGGRVDRVARVQNEELRLHTLDPELRAVEAGRAITFDDLTGMSELMGRMTPQEYADVRSWVAQGSMTPDGRLDRSQTMSPEAVARSAAILDELRDQGVPYEVVRDRSPGQIAARIQGTKISVRLTDTRANESFVGRVWDDGASLYYTTNQIDPETGRTMRYTPSTTEVVNLVRMAQGLPVQRSDGNGLVGHRGSYVMGRGERATQLQESYYVDNGVTHMAAVGDLPTGRPGAKVFVRRSAKERSAASTWFDGPEAAQRYLQDKVESARETLTSALDVDRLLAEYEEHTEAAQAGEHYPDFSGDTEVAAIQRAYWDVLRGAQDTLLRPGATVEEYQERTAFLAEVDMGPDQRRVIHDMQVAELAYTGTPIEKVRAHLEQVPDGMVGTYEPREVVDAEGVHHMKRFDPIRVVKYMDSEHGTARNTSDVVSALRTAGIDPGELMGEGYGARSVKDRMIAFDEPSARMIEDLPEGSMVRAMAQVAQESLERAGVEAVELRADDNGIISWTGQRLGRTGKELAKPISGQIGQIFEQGEHGEIVTSFASGENYMMVPGYEARIAAQRPGEDLSVQERTLLRGYEQQMAQAVQYRIAQDVMVARTETGEPTSLNGVYRRLYDERLPVDFLERAEERGMGRDWAATVLDTLARRVRYPDSMGDTFYQSWRRDNGEAGIDPANDNHFDALVLSGGTNMAIIGPEAGGYFDPDMTNASKMGTTFYLTQGAAVDPETGRITPSDDLDDRAPLMKHPETENMRFNSWDRRQMIASMLLHATGVTEPEKVLMSDHLKGWTADDGRVVSKDYAQRNQMLGSDGTMRPLTVGDKDSDLHGNKGVIGLVIDPDMDLEEARAAGIEQAVLTFRANPGLSVVMSPFSGVSRFNGGSAREMMEDTSDAVLPDGKVIPDAIGTMRFVITNKDVEGGTRHYDEDALAQGRGRRASAQLAWGLGSVEADAVMAEFYGPNGAGATNLREMLITMGLDMSEDGTLADQQLPATAEQRALLEMPELVTTATGSLHSSAMRRQFAELITDRGGDLEVPFPMTFPTGVRVPETGHGTWRLPVLSSHLRTGTELDDGTVSAHDYTNQYQAVHDHACAYRYSMGQLERDDLTPERRRDLERKMAEAPGRAQQAFDMITSSLAQRHFSGRRNIFKEQVMSARLPNSATAVWTADPRLALDQLGMGPDLAEGLGVGDDDEVVIWRDPVLRDGGVRSMRVKVDDRLTGVAINPVMDASFDGDFDGDSVGIAVLGSERAKQQARERLSVEANLLDLGRRTAIEIDGDEIEVYPLNMQDSLDTKVSQHFDPALTQRFKGLTRRANEVYEDLQSGDIDRREYLAANRGVLAELSDYYGQAFAPEAGSVTLRFGSVQDHMASLKEAAIDTGAKGSPSKLVAYGWHLGVDQDGVDHGRPLHTAEDDRGVQVAVTVKTAVGIAGTYSQRGVKALRNEALKPVLELTYPVTQSLLQAKHDPTEAMHKYTMLMGPARQLWRGRKMQQVLGEDDKATWTAFKDETGSEVQATTEEWKAQFVKMYESSSGLNVPINTEYVEQVANSLGKDGVMVDIEERSADVAMAAKGSTMDRLAYGGTFEDVMAAAARGENLFEGNQNACFAPYAVRANQKALAAHRDAHERRADPTRGVPAPELETIAARDVLAPSDPRARARGTGRRSDAARTVRAPRPAPVITELDLDNHEPAAVAGDNDYSM